MNKPICITLEDLKNRKTYIEFEINKNNEKKDINYEYVCQFLKGALAEIEYLIKKLEIQRINPTKFDSIVNEWGK